MNKNVLRGAVCALAVGALCAPASAVAAGANHGLDLRVRHGTSENWSGYALTGPGPYENVSASWTQPAVNCAKTRNGCAAILDGIDGDAAERSSRTGTEGELVAPAKPRTAHGIRCTQRVCAGLPEPVVPGDRLEPSGTDLGQGACSGLVSQFGLRLSDRRAGLDAHR